MPHPVPFAPSPPLVTLDAPNARGQLSVQPAGWWCSGTLHIIKMGQPETIPVALCWFTDEPGGPRYQDITQGVVIWPFSDGSCIVQTPGHMTLGSWSQP